VLYQPFCEMDLEHFHEPPQAAYFINLLDQLDRVEIAVRRKHRSRAMVARNPRELAHALQENKLAIVHAVEGGFHLGADALTVSRNVRSSGQERRRLHTWRISSGAGGLKMYRRFPSFPTLPIDGCSPSGTSALQKRGKLSLMQWQPSASWFDVSHMTEAAMADTFERLPPRTPVIASHVACRFAGYDYNLTDNSVRKIVRRGGVLGVILCEHFCNEGHTPTKNFDESVEAVRRQIDRIHDLADTGIRPCRHRH